MKKVLDLLSLLDEEESSDYCEKTFGKYLFGEFEKFYGGNKEKNTELEQDTFNKVLGWVEQAGQRQALIKCVNDLMKCRDHFPKVLQQKDGIFYRAVTLPEKNEDIQRMREIEIKMNKPPENEKEYVKYFLDNVVQKLSYKPRYKLESWATHKTAAKNFAIKSKHVLMNPGMRQGCCFIIKAKLPKAEIIFNPKFMNKLAVETGWWPQNEIIRITKNKKPIEVSAFYMPFSERLFWYRIPKSLKPQIKKGIADAWKKF